MAVRVCFVVAFLALFACGALAASDRTLGTVNGACKDSFSMIMTEQYKDDAKCADSIRTAMTVVPTSSAGAECPGGAVAVAGSEVQKCMSKNDSTRTAWINFIKSCEVLNVNERTGAGEAEAAAEAKPSCFPRFNSLAAFQDYINGNGKPATSAASAAKVAGGVALLTAAAALLL